MSDPNRIEDGDIVRVQVVGQNKIIADNAIVLHVPVDSGDSWILKELSFNVILYISEGCTIALLKKGES